MCSYAARVSAGGSARLEDLSVGGARLRVDSKADIGQTVSLSVAFPGYFFRVRFRARVVHRSPNVLGVEFARLSARQRQILDDVIAELALQDPTKRQVVPRGVSNS